MTDTLIDEQGEALAAKAGHIPDAPRMFEGLRTWLAENDVEGIVWHHPDGRMAKIKARDFGLKRGPSK
jgi:hypothetical protein